MMFTVIIGFLVFFCLHAVSVRFLPRPRSVYRVLLTLVASWVGGVVVTWFLAHGVLSVILLTLIAVCYVLGVFIIVDSSIHVRILLLIAERENGLTKKELLAQCNRNVIVGRRLARLMDAGELRYQRGTYQLAKRTTSLLLVRERLSRMIERLFS